MSEILYMSNLYVPTLKEDPADAEIASHKLLMRAGMIRKVASGIYAFLPLGMRVLQKVENIVREEMNATGAQEILMPALQPAELWLESGRWDDYGPELMRMNDRHDHGFCLGPTHEELITALVRNELRSYRQLPTTLYQIQTKYRDEIRPRFGLLRSREFIMKDAYSFHSSVESLQETYDQMSEAYGTICERCGLDYRPVEADSVRSAARLLPSSWRSPMRARQSSSTVLTAIMRRTPKWLSASRNRSSMMLLPWRRSPRLALPPLRRWLNSLASMRLQP